MANWIQAEAAQQVIPNGDTEVIGTLAGLAAADRIVGILEADQPGNLTVEFSIDGQNWDYVETVAVVANTGVKVSTEIVAPFVRVRYNNTGAAPTTFVRSGFKASSAGPR